MAKSTSHNLYSAKHATVSGTGSGDVGADRVRQIDDEQAPPSPARHRRSVRAAQKRPSPSLLQPPLPWKHWDGDSERWILAQRGRFRGTLAPRNPLPALDDGVATNGVSGREFTGKSVHGFDLKVITPTGN